MSTGAIAWLEQSIHYPPTKGYPLHITAKRYWLPAFEAYSEDPDALTLIFLHGTSFCKEIWEPTLDSLFRMASMPGVLKIREAICIDCPNHGEASAFNDDALLQPEFFNNFTCEKYALAVHHFLDAGPEAGAKIDFRQRNLVGIGHSLGGVAMCILQSLEPLVNFSSMIIVEPLLSPAGPEHLERLRYVLVKGAYERRDVWPDRTQAMHALRKRQRTSKWDPSTLVLFVRHAIRQHPGARHKDAPYLGVTLACSRDQEAAMYRDVDGPTKPIADLNKACARMPVHLIIGGINDFISPRIHAAMTDVKSGRRFASVTKIEETGHLIPLEVPEKLGEVLYACLVDSSASISNRDITPAPLVMAKL
ncbi:Alpha/beta hydrolase family-domain-containing protein [Flagelloscypha sp. PMI_526]|nr:Alpha/beta hydrolase family-domain-containing protein [Flagelloscypha sp. PMI_526]